ncbi:lipopolysaccharide biosynthesis protein [Winogradskyella sp.]|uniref:lipopolysaccharide biosynthesis protein n=1 Tax=Winogradskyella sp. TaxID=1883156 RepID=UPI003AB1D64C
MKKKINTSLKYGILYTVSNAFQKGIGFFVFMYFAGILSIKEYASFGLNYSFFTVVCMFSYAGINESVIGQLKKEKNTSDLFKTANSVFVLFSLISLLIFVPVYKIIYLESSLSFVNIFSITLGAILLSFFTFQSIIVRLKEAHLHSVVYSFFPPLLGYILGFYLVFTSKESFSYFKGVLYAAFISLFVLFFFRKHFIGFSKSTKQIKLIIFSALPYIAIAFFAWILGYGNTFLINYLFDELQVATYVFLFTIASVLQLVANSMNQVWSPKFYNIFQENNLKEIEKKYGVFTIVQGAIIGLIGALIIVVFPIVASYFESFNKYEGVEFSMFFLFGGYLVSIPWWHTQNYYLIKNQGKKLMNLTLISSLFGLVLWIAMMFFLKEIGIYLGFFFQLLIKSLLVYFYGQKKWDIKFHWKGTLIGLGILLIAVWFNLEVYGL